MKISVVGMSHRTAPIELRERVAAHTRDLDGTVARLLRMDGVEEACVISTCNRIEIYTAGRIEPEQMRRQVRLFIAENAGVLTDTLEEKVVQQDRDQALLHLFRVASSLDSMVLGEPQILGQVKDAFRRAQELGAIRSELNPAFQKAFSVAKKVRTETGIAENAVSMSFAAVELGRQIFADLHGREVLLVGAGKMGGLAAKHLWTNGVGKIRVANRTLAAAERLAEEVRGSAASLSDLPMLLSTADIVICSTASPDYVIDRKMVSKVLRHRRYRPLLIVDIALPRDVDPRVGELDNVFVYDVDDLEGVLEQNRQRRHTEAEAAENLIRDEVSRYMAWRNSQRVVPVIKALRQQASGIVQAELERTLGHGESGLDPRVEKKVRAMGNAIMNKLLHPVLTRLKQDGEHGQGDMSSEAVLRLFQLQLEAMEVPVEDDTTDARTSRDNVVQLRSS